MNVWVSWYHNIDVHFYFYFIIKHLTSWIFIVSNLNLFILKNISRPVLCKIRVTWTQTLGYHDAMTICLLTETATKWVAGRIFWTKGWLMFWVRHSRMAWDFITLLRMVHNSELKKHRYWNFPFNIFGPQLTKGIWKYGKENHRYGVGIE